MYPWLKEEKPFVPGPIRNSARFEALASRGAKPVRKTFEESMKELQEAESARPRVRDLPPKPLSERMKALSVPTKDPEPKSSRAEEEKKTTVSVRDLPAAPLSDTIKKLADTSNRAKRDKFQIEVEKREKEQKEHHERIAKLSKDPSNEEYWKGLATPLRPIPKPIRKVESLSATTMNSSGPLTKSKRSSERDSTEPPLKSGAQDANMTTTYSSSTITVPPPAATSAE